MFRDSVTIPVIGVGGLLHPDQATRVLDDGVPLVALGRALLLDADWVTKVQDGRVSEIRMKLNSESERRSLEIPKPMKEYTKRSIAIATN
jgi:2,4-dienoyl-CoA reductase-like NADH-dependent reductase (Old Yellow Enzyme family)